MNDVTLILRQSLSFTQFAHTILIGGSIGIGGGAFLHLFQPWLTTNLAGIADVAALSYSEWAAMGVGMAFLVKISVHRKVVGDRSREVLNLIEEAIRRGKLGPAQAKQIYHTLAFRLANTAEMGGNSDHTAHARGIVDQVIQEETDGET
ncbi:MAG: hypothetical protein HQL41_11825 [Alphaproteobacteria bacterium]|nr:hypothetical protein [Alphaproteobacteria bacterium]